MLIHKTFNHLFIRPLAVVALLLVTAATQAQEKRARFVTIPVNGQIGVDTVADGFTKTFEMAARDQFNTVLVLTFDSEGGSELEAERIIEAIENTGDRFERIGIVKRCIGPALGILLTCNRIYIADPQPEGTVIEFQATWSGSSDDNAQQLQFQQDLYRKLASNKPSWKPIIEAMIDPNVDLYAWKGGPDTIKTSNTEPDVKTDVMHIQLTEALGLSAKQAIAAGLAKPLVGGMEGLGKDLGFDTFRASATNGSVLMANATKNHLAVDTKVDATIDRAFKQISAAKDLINDLPRQQYFAEQADPRSQKYESRYNFSWRRDSWVHTGPSMSSWRKNTDNAIQQWQVVVNTLDRIGALGNEARSEIDFLQEESKNWPPESERHDVLSILQTQLDELLAQGDSLQVMRNQAVSQIDFFQRNRNNPVW